MGMKLTITVSEEATAVAGGAGAVPTVATSDQVPSPPGDDIQRRYDELRRMYDDMQRTLPQDAKPFPDEGVDGFLSHFIISMEFLQGPLKNQVMSLSMPPALQTVSRSKPFRYRRTAAGHQVNVPLPRASSLPRTIRESDFLHRPAEFFEEGAETVWMQILNLDAKMQTEVGPIRIILGETLKREYPDIFQPSLGIAQSLSPAGGFPARLFFNPYAIIETPMGSMRAIHGTLSYGRITGFPPVGTPVTICEVIPLEGVEEVRQIMAATPEVRTAVSEKIEPFARIIALAHPIDVGMQVSGDEAFELVERSIQAKV